LYVTRVRVARDAAESAVGVECCFDGRPGSLDSWPVKIRSKEACGKRWVGSGNVESCHGRLLVGEWIVHDGSPIPALLLEIDERVELPGQDGSDSCTIRIVGGEMRPRLQKPSHRPALAPSPVDPVRRPQRHVVDVGIEPTRIDKDIVVAKQKRKSCL